VVRLVRGLDAPSGEFRLARRLNTPSGGVRLAQGLTPLGQGPPRSRAQRPLGEDRLDRGHLHERCSRSCPRVWVFNALTPLDACHDPDTPENCVPVLFHQLPGGGHPLRCVTLCDEAGVSSAMLCRLPPYG
jgi:hypothetical protein